MPASLIDKSVWVALAFDAHPRHDDAAAIFGRMTPAEPSIFSRSTQQSFLRHSTTPQILRQYGAEAVNNSQALESLRRIQQHPAVAYREGSHDVESTWHRLAERSTASPKVWIDAYWQPSRSPADTASLRWTRTSRHSWRPVWTCCYWRARSALRRGPLVMLELEETYEEPIGDRDVGITSGVPTRDSTRTRSQTQTWLLKPHHCARNYESSQRAFAQSQRPNWTR